MAPMNRREALRLLSLTTVAALGSACQVTAPLSLPGGQPTQVAPTPIPSTPTPVPADIAALPAVRLAIDVDPDTLDPAGQTNPSIGSIVDHLAETLVRLQPDGSVGPGLARTLTQSADGRT
jgi:ABC-type transport system substrate-binding protein